MTIRLLAVPFELRYGQNDMGSAGYSPSELARGRSLFSLFNVLNTISFQLLSGNIITLYALRLGSGDFLIGVLSAFMGLSPIMVLVGRPLVRYMRATTLMGLFWTVRYLALIPLLFSPPLALTGFHDLAVTLLVLSVLGFNSFRGIAITTFNPILGALAGERDRGQYVSFVQLLVNLSAPVVGIAMALLLGGSAPLGMYAVFFGVGIASGLYGSYLIFRLPEPHGFATQASQGLLAATRKAFSSKGSVLFFASFFAVTFVTSMAGPFFIVAMKEVYGAGDSAALILTVIGGMGAVVMALTSGLTLDRLGARPLYFFFTLAWVVGLVPLIASPPLGSMTLWWLFGSIVFLVFSFGSSGSANAAQTYLLSISGSSENLNLGIVYQLVAGIAAATGSLAGGFALEGLGNATAWPVVDVFRLFFGIVAALGIGTLLLVFSLESVGAYTIRDSIGIIFSPRDMRALTLLRRLRRSRSVDEEESVINALAQSQSEVSIEELLAKLRSPRFIIRSAALSALRGMPPDERITRALIGEVREHPYTTAYMAAEILGEKGAKEGREALRAGLSSRDFFLSGKCMVALARLGDRESLPVIRSTVESTQNPRLITHGAAAAEILRDGESVRILVEKLATRPVQAHIREEIVLSISGILGMQEWFYPLFSAYLESAESGRLGLVDYVSTRERESRRDLTPLKSLVEESAGDGPEFREHVEDVLARLTPRREEAAAVSGLLTGLKNSGIATLPAYQFLLAATAVWIYFHGARLRAPKHS